jgi:cyclase
VSWTRRDFLASSAVAVAAGVIGRGSAARAWQQPPPINPVFTPVRRNVGVFTGRGGTIGYLISPAGVLVVDSQYPDAATLCLDGLRERSGGRSIDVLINTHHHADHTGGNVAFKAVTRRIVAQARVPDLQRQANAQATTPTDQVYADTTFPDAWETRVGDETVRAAYFGPAHTGGDAVVHFEQANVVHVGDLVFNRLQAYVDRPGGASVVHWIAMVEQILNTYPADAVYVFGHASAKFQVTGGRGDLVVMRDYLTALVEYVRGEMKAGRSRDDVLASTAVLKGFEDYGALTTRALTGTYDELAAS